MIQVYIEYLELDWRSPNERISRSGRASWDLLERLTSDGGKHSDVSTGKESRVEVRAAQPKADTSGLG